MDVNGLQQWQQSQHPPDKMSIEYEDITKEPSLRYKMTRTLNISLNVPDSYGIEELTRQLTEYGERLISRRNRVQKSKKCRSQTFLKGLSLPDGSTDKELIEEYISEKYGV